MSRKRIMQSMAAMLVASVAGAATAQQGDALCADPAEACRAVLEPSCLQRFSAGALSAAEDCAGQNDAYLSCLATAAERCGAAAGGSASCSAEDARQLFAAIDQTSRSELQAFVAACDGTAQALIARSRLDALGAEAAPNSPSRDAAQAPPRAPEAIVVAPASGACTPLPTPFTTPIRVAVGSTICAPDDPSTSIRVSAVEPRGVRYSNGPFGAMTCRVNEVCGVHWSATHRFRVVVDGQPTGYAVLQPQ